MIKTTDLNKYYLKGRQNEIHVINDCNLELPDTGLVTILGESGSGKTTLLNVIGGLDRAKGQIDYDGKVFNGYKMNAIDKYRRENFGYIFQNYNILPELTIIENLATALEIVGIIDKEEQDKRIKIALNAVGLYKFRKKPAGKLSGGQMQRVAIARALVKKCKILIADEPTGNLDSTNSIEIMNILKKISETTLVLLVTHDKQLAEFYSTKIIELTDGKITNIREANNNISLQNKDENKIYLKDLNQVTSNDNGIKTVAFSEGELPNINITLVEKNGTFYIKSNVKIKSLDESNLMLIDDHYHETTVEEYKDKLDYDTESFDDSHKSKNFKKIFIVIKDGLKNFFKVRKRTKAFRFIFILLGIILGYMAVLATQYIKRDYSSVLDDKAVYSLRYDVDRVGGQISSKLDEAYNNGVVKSIDRNPYYDFRNFKDSYEFIYYKNVYETVSYSVSTFCISYDVVKDSGLKSGREPKNSDEIVIGKKLANKLVKKMKFDSYEDIFDSIDMDLGKIVGVSNSNTSTVYLYADTTSEGFGWFSADAYQENTRGMEYFLYDSNLNYKTMYGRTLNSDDTKSVYLVISDNNNHMVTIDEYYYKETLTDEEVDTMITNMFVWNYFDVQDSILYKDSETNEYMYNTGTNKYKVVGIGKVDGIDGNFPSIVTNDINFFYDNEFHYGSKINKEYYEVLPYSKYSNKFELVDGSLPTNINECIVPAYYGIKVGEQYKSSSSSINYNKTYTVSGVFVPTYNSNVDNTSLYNDYKVYVTDLDYKFFQIEYNNNYGVYLTVTDIDELKTILGDLDYELFNVRQSMIDDIEKDAKSDNFKTLITILVLLGVVLIYIYFTMRSKLIHDIYEIGVLRNIGASTKSIYSKYLIEIIITTLFTTMLGYLGFLIVYNFIYHKAKIIGSLFGSYSVLETPYPYIGILIIFLLNILVGLIPVFMLLRKTPKEISSKYDI
ncbi:MAG: ATP-binding cassette domain-containing protein [Acholeplasmatales bacterium]|nr:ATP-binding cassette domain-containing protein [Acholeplasmatales bacterium]